MAISDKRDSHGKHSSPFTVLAQTIATAWRINRDQWGSAIIPPSDSILTIMDQLRDLPISDVSYKAGMEQLHKSLCNAIGIPMIGRTKLMIFIPNSFNGMDKHVVTSNWYKVHDVLFINCGSIWFYIDLSRRINPSNNLYADGHIGDVTDMIWIHRCHQRPTGYWVNNMKIIFMSVLEGMTPMFRSFPKSSALTYTPLQHHLTFEIERLDRMQTVLRPLLQCADDFVAGRGMIFSFGESEEFNYLLMASSLPNFRYYLSEALRLLQHRGDRSVSSMNLIVADPTGQTIYTHPINQRFHTIPIGTGKLHLLHIEAGLWCFLPSSEIEGKCSIINTFNINTKRKFVVTAKNPVLTFFFGGTVTMKTPTNRVTIRNPNFKAIYIESSINSLIELINNYIRPDTSISISSEDRMEVYEHYTQLIRSDAYWCINRSLETIRQNICAIRGVPKAESVYPLMITHKGQLLSHTTHRIMVWQDIWFFFAGSCWYVISFDDPFQKNGCGEYHMMPIGAEKMTISINDEIIEVNNLDG